jgi:hypothetical protein
VNRWKCPRFFFSFFSQTNLDLEMTQSMANDPEDLNRELCDLCDLDTEAMIACKQCLVKLCDSHSKNHIITKLTKTHQLIPLDQIDSDTVFAVDASHFFTKYSQPCNLHNLIADKFCEECL